MNSEARILIFSVGWWILLILFFFIFYPHNFNSITYLAIISYLTFFLLGFLCFKQFVPIKKNIKIDVDFHNKFIRKTLIFLTIFLWFFCFMSIQNFYKYGILYRDIYINEPQLIFGSVLVSYFFKTFFINFVYFILISYLCLEKPSNKIKLTFIFFTLLPIAILTIGRFPVYEIIFFTIVISLMNGGLKGLIKLIPLITVIPLLFSILLFYSKIDIGNIPLFKVFTEIFLDYFVNYHFIGFYFFNWVVENSWLFTNEIIPCMSLGFIDDFLLRVSEGLYGSDLGTSCLRENQLILTRGLYIPELDGNYNTFTTNLTPLYIDGGYAGVCVGAFIFGFISGVQKKSGYLVSPIFLLCCFCLFFGIFLPKFNSPLFFLFLVYSQLFAIIQNIFKTSTVK